MSAHDPLPLLLRGLNLPHVAQEHAAALARAEAENWGYRRFLLHLAGGEANERLRRRSERQIRESGLPGGKTLGTLDEARLPEKVAVAHADRRRAGADRTHFSGPPGLRV